MPQSNIVQLTPRNVHPPVCTKCGCTMWIVSQTRQRPADEQQVFECPCCPSEERWPVVHEA